MSSPLILMPHGYCLSWQPELVWAFILGNSLIALSYFSIPLVIFRFVRARQDIEFRSLHWLFAAFILACGLTHVLHVVELWWPIYYFESLVDMGVALISMATAVVLWKVLPVLLEFPSVAHLQRLNQQLSASEARLREKEALLRTIADGVPESYLYEYTVDADGTPRFLHLSSGVERLHGVSLEAVLADASILLGQIDPAQRQAYLEAGAQSRASLSDFSANLRMQRADGEWRWFRLQSHPRPREDGQVVWDGFVMDITDQHLYENEINRLAQAIEQNPVGIMITDEKGELEYINQAFTRLTGYAFAALYGRSAKALLSAEMSDGEFAALEHELARGRSWQGIVANRHRNGDMRWQEVVASSLLDASGKPRQRLYVLQDVTERERLVVENKLAACVLTASNEAVMVCGADNLILSVNPSFCRITGYSAEDVIGKPPAMLSSGRHNRAFYEAMWRDINGKGQWSGEIWNRRKDGIVYPEWLSISTFCDVGGKVVNYISIFSDITQRKAAEAEIHHLAHYDPLTNLPNRVLLRDRVNVALASAQRRKGHVALMYLDLDRFKNINDSLGHPVGDAMLVEVARRISSLLREEDTVSRIGGDEFVVVAPDTDIKGASSVAEKILAVVGESFTIDRHELSIGVSMGIAVYPDNGTDFRSLSQAADTALYRAKQAGRNNYKFFTEELQIRAQNLLQIESALRRAVERNELELYYQPQFTITGSTIIGAEALLRWRHPEMGLIPPGKFIPVAEECGLILDIGSFVLRRAVAEQAERLRQGLAVVPVAVNLSLAQFRQPALYDEIADLLREFDLPAPLLELELTESMAMEDASYVIKTVDRFRSLGLTLSIDDFGTGYSSLSYLKRIRVQKLKIDQSFVRDITEDGDDEAIVSAIISMASSLKFEVIAEGVETEAQRVLLQEHGCKQAQGYLFSYPLPNDEFCALLQSRS